MWTADRRLYHDADRERILEEGDPDARFLLVGEGDELPEEEAKRLGLLKVAPKPADKARRPSRNK